MFGRTEEEALDIRAKLGEPDAIKQRNQNRLSIVKQAGGEIA